MSLASYILKSNKTTPIGEAFDVKVLGFERDSKSLYLNIGGISYKYSPKEDNGNLVSLAKNLLKSKGNPVTALKDLKQYSNIEKVNSIPNGLLKASSLEDLDKLSQ